MKLTLLPLQNDDLIRVRCEGAVSCREEGDPLETLLGPRCYTHTVLLDLERSQVIDTSGIHWLVQNHRRFDQGGGKLVLHAVPPVVVDVLNFLRLTPLLHIAPGDQAAGEPPREPGNDTPPQTGPGGRAIRFPG